jgi:hypothetical protein
METFEIITEEAKRLLEEESRLLAEELKQEAVAEALRSRGRPVEVTASDVRKARIRFIKRERQLLPMTNLVLRIYAILGGFLFIGGLLYPFVKPLIEKADLVSRISLMVSGMGLVLLFAAAFGRYYFAHRYQMRAREELEKFEEMRIDERKT